MREPVCKVDAFEEGPLRGNPAAVCVLDDWLSNGVLQAIVAQNNLSDTTFMVDAEGHCWVCLEGEIDLRDT